MLSSILKKSDCSSCKFCCSFRRASLWETPLFDKNTKEKLEKLYPDVKFKKSGNKGTAYTFDISDCYKTPDPQEEAPCPFLNANTGCTLSADLKPFDCSIWPLRAVKEKDGTLSVALTPTCPAINKIPHEKIKSLVDAGLGKKILAQAEKFPDMVKDKTEFLSIIVSR